MQHGGPPSALLARAAEHEPATLAVDRRTDGGRDPRPGAGRRGAAWPAGSPGPGAASSWSRPSWPPAAGSRSGPGPGGSGVAELDLPPAVAPPTQVPPMPAEDRPARRPGRAASCTRCSCGSRVGSWTEPGPATAWARQRVPLVDGEEPTGLQRLMVARRLRQRHLQRAADRRVDVHQPRPDRPPEPLPGRRVALPRGRRRRRTDTGSGSPPRRCTTRRPSRTRRPVAVHRAALTRALTLGHRARWASCGERLAEGQAWRSAMSWSVRIAPAS